MTEQTLREAIEIWQQRLRLTGLGLVETRVECTRVDATLAHLARRTPGQFTTELAYPWSQDHGSAGALLGVIADSGSDEQSGWSSVDAA